MVKLYLPATYPDNAKFLACFSTETSRFDYLGRVMQPEISRQLRSLDYQHFLETLYWKIVRDFVVRSQKRTCMKCKHRRSLHVHHDSYEHVGYEYLHLGELVVLCGFCHEQLHKPNAELDALLANLTGSKKVDLREKVVDNPNYDPRVVMNLKQYGNIMGPQHE